MMRHGRWMVVAVLVMPACNALLGVDVCDKQCDVDADCGGGYTCKDSKCGGSACGTSNTNSVSSGSSGAVSSSSSGSTSHSSSSSSTSSTTSSSTSTSSTSSTSSSSSTSSTSSTSSSSSSSSGSTTCVAGSGAGTSCGVGLICNNTGNCISACFINNRVVGSGADPGNLCRVCAPMVSTTGWTNATANTPCGPAAACADDKCNANGMCIPAQKCVNDATNTHCFPSGTCGCTQRSDCASGNTCNQTTHLCEACNTATACGQNCGNCRSLPQSIGDAAYYVCSGATGNLAQACQVMPCASGTANCNLTDSDQCEINVTNDPLNCAACNVRCDQTFTCTASQCTCQDDNNCPLNQTCSGSNNRCRCNQNQDCPQGYSCSNRVCVR